MIKKGYKKRSSKAKSFVKKGYKKPGSTIEFDYEDD